MKPTKRFAAIVLAIVLILVLTGSALAQPTIIVNRQWGPQLGVLANDTEVRCVNPFMTAAPAFTLPEIVSSDPNEPALAVYKAAVVFKSPNSTPPVITNNSGYHFPYFRGDDTDGNIFNYQAGKYYRMTFEFNGVFIVCSIEAVQPLCMPIIQHD